MTVSAVDWLPLAAPIKAGAIVNINWVKSGPAVKMKITKMLKTQNVSHPLKIFFLFHII